MGESKLIEIRLKFPLSIDRWALCGAGGGGAKVPVYHLLLSRIMGRTVILLMGN